MRKTPKCSFRIHSSPEKLDELCCLYVLGDLSPQDRELLEQHLGGCEACRDSVRGFEKVVLFDLPAAAVARAENGLPEIFELPSEREILTGVLQKAGASFARETSHGPLLSEFASPCVTPWWKRTAKIGKIALPAAGWAIAACLLIWVFGVGHPDARINLVAVSTASPAHFADTRNDAELKGRLAAVEKQREAAEQKMGDVEVQARRNSLALSQMSDHLLSLNSAYTQLQAELVQAQNRASEKSAELELTRSQLNEEVAAKESLQGQLGEISTRFEKQRDEVARLEKVAGTVPARLPVVERSLGDNEAKDILGARDLHIVDVYDVDNRGRSAGAYGRVYYVNRSLLVFYAFDLSELEKNHRAVAFQAWGFRQPQSTTAESLGLFYLDDARLNRWALRVSDPQLLSRIDTLFVTVEPPGGSHFPKGRRLLMASLAGPANHP